MRALHLMVAAGVVALCGPVAACSTKVPVTSSPTVTDGATSQPQPATVTVTFEPLASGSTMVEIHQVGLPDEESSASHTAGWSDALAGLERRYA